MLTTKNLDSNSSDIRNHHHKINELEQEKIILLRLMELSGNKADALEQFKKNLEEKIKQLYGNLEQSENRYRELYEGAPDLYRTIDTNGIILDCNKAYADSLGYSKDEVIGSPIFDHVCCSDLSSMRDSFDSWKRTGHVENREILMKRKNGSTFPVLISASNLYDENGDLIGSNTIIKDITEITEARKKLEESKRQIQKQLDDLQQTEKIKSEFLTMITHELKTPLVPIKAYLDMLMSEALGPLSKPQRERLQIIKSSSESLYGLIQDLLDAQKLEIGKLRLDLKSHDLSAIVQHTIVELLPDAEKYGIKITTELEKGVFCKCDRGRIEQVLTNIISNSLDFCAKETGHIHIKLHSIKNNAKIMIKDNGIGITQTEIDKIFVKFYQANTSNTREHGGTGLGLVICKGLVESHCGKIWLESEGNGKGTEVHILLPKTEEKTDK